MGRCFNLLAWLAVMIFSMAAQAKDAVHVKIAVFENFRTEAMIPDSYINFFREGLELGKQHFSTPELTFEIREFAYTDGEKSLVTKARELQEWQPHVIIGPSSSNHFLMMPDYFQNIVVLSPLATADAVATMPSSFHSLSQTNATLAKGLSRFVEMRFKDAKIFPVVQVDCKNCVSFADAFRDKMSVCKAVQSTSLFLDEPKKDDLKALAKAYRTGDLILLPNHSGVSGRLMALLSDHLKDDVIFIGNDNWGDWKGGFVGRFPSAHKYRGYMVQSLSLLAPKAQTKKFIEDYRKVFKHAPLTISQVNYQIVDLIGQIAGRVAPGKLTRETFLEAFLKARKENPELGRDDSLYLHRISQDGEFFETSISIRELSL